MPIPGSARLVRRVNSNDILNLKLTLTGGAVYNKWHETELDRWLSDHNVPHPKAADRKDLENLVKDNWNDKIVNPYYSWDAQSLQKYLSLKGTQAKKGTEKNTKSLAEQVKEYWTETEDSANQAYGSVRDWIFDTYVLLHPPQIEIY